MNIYLIRHGQVDSNLKYGYEPRMETTLDEEGENQARLLGKRISNFKIDIIYSGQYKRTTQTADIINTYLKKKIEISENLDEINMGDVLIKGWDAIKKENSEWYKEWSQHKKDIAYPNGESGEEVRKRARIFLKKITRMKLKNIAIITHGGVIKVILSDILGLDLSKRFNLEIDNCSISKIEYSKINNRFSVKYINDISHLE